MNPIFKPKKANILVPNHGVVSRENFTQDHFKALLKRAHKAKVDQDSFIKQHFDVVGYGDLPLFDHPEQETDLKAKIEAERQESERLIKEREEAERLKAEEEELERLLKQEEAEKEANKQDTASE